MTKQTTITVNIVVALACEAKPLIDFFGLKKVMQKPFVLFQDLSNQHLETGQSQAKINVLAAGIGEQNMAVACGWLAAQSESEGSVWLNLGIAGHRTIELGNAVLIARSGSSDFEQKLHYPPLIADWKGEVASLTTFNSVVDQYPEVDCVDMEAYAYFSAAKKFAEAEFVQAIKVISDNQYHSSTELTAAIISELIADSVADIVGFIQSLVKCKLAVSLTKPVVSFSDLPVQHLRFSQRQSEMLIEYANKFINLELDPISYCQQATDAKQLLQSMQTELQDHAPRLSL